MSYLLDTHIVLWWAAKRGRIPESIAEIISDPDRPVFVSVASAWEFTIKRAKGRLEGPTNFHAMMEFSGFKALDITLRHALHVEELPKIHEDPFDRILISQAAVEGMTLITADRHILKYDISVLAV